MVTLASAIDGARTAVTVISGNNVIKPPGGSTNAFVGSGCLGDVDVFGTRPSMSAHSCELKACEPKTPNVDGKLNCEKSSPPEPPNRSADTVTSGSVKSGTAYFFRSLRIFAM